MRQYPTQAEVQYYVALGRKLRAEALERMGRRIWARLTGRGRPVETTVRDPEAALIEMRTPLTAIRSFTEILIDNPAMPVAERSRFLEILLTEERRLEQAIERAGDRLARP
jgi:signal transduction histidine kinase